MKLKDAVLSVMQRDDLKVVVQDYEIEGVDLRSREEMAHALRAAKRVRVDALLEYLDEQQVKAVCELTGVSSTGRRRALIERLIEARLERLVIRRNRPGQEAEADDEDEVPPSTANNEPRSQWTDPPRETTVPGLTITKPELIWPGKYDGQGNHVINRGVALPFQVVETIQEGRATREPGRVSDLFSAKPSGNDEWRNKLIWGDNLLVMVSLLEEFAGKVDLIYIDPPFSKNEDFSVKVQVAEASLEKASSVIEEKAHRVTWGTGYASYLAMLADRLVLMRYMLSSTGSIFVHIGPDVSHYVRSLLEDVFGSQGFLNEVIWQRTDPHNDAKQKFGNVHDSLFWFKKGDRQFYDFGAVRDELTQAAEKEYSLLELDTGEVVAWQGNESRAGRRFKVENATWKGKKNRFRWRGALPSPNREWIYDEVGMEAALGWEWEMGLHDPLVQQARQSHGVRLRLLNIPREVMERQAVDRGDVRFFDLAHLEAEVISVDVPSPRSTHARGRGRKIKVRLTNFVIPDTDLIPEEVCGKIRKWSDYVDYWAVDWDFQHDTFMNQWQAYRTRKNRKLDLESAEHEFDRAGKYKILVKVVDIFGNDTSQLLTWEVR